MGLLNPALLFMESKILQFRGPDVHAHVKKALFDKPFDAFNFNDPYDDFYVAMSWSPNGPFADVASDSDEEDERVNQHDRSRRWFVKALRNDTTGSVLFTAEDEDHHPGPCFSRGTSYAYRTGNNDAKAQMARRAVLYHKESVRYELTAPQLYGIPYINEHVRQKIRRFLTELQAEISSADGPSPPHQFWDEKIIRRHPATASFVRSHQPTQNQLEYGALRDSLRRNEEAVKDLEEVAAVEGTILRSALAFTRRQAPAQASLFPDEEKHERSPSGATEEGPSEDEPAAAASAPRKISPEVVAQTAGISRVRSHRTPCSVRSHNHTRCCK